jgi:hypothetical protein
VLNKTKITAATYVPELMNPYKFKLLLSDPAGKTWDDANNIYVDVGTKITLDATDNT